MINDAESTKQHQLEGRKSAEGCFISALCQTSVIIISVRRQYSMQCRKSQASQDNRVLTPIRPHHTVRYITSTTSPPPLKNAWIFLNGATVNLDVAMVSANNKIQTWRQTGDANRANCDRPFPPITMDVLRTVQEVEQETSSRYPRKVEEKNKEQPKEETMRRAKQ